MTKLTFHFREIRKQKRIELKKLRSEIVASTHPILDKHKGNVVIPENRNKDFSKISYDIHQIADAYANAIANASNFDDMKNYGNLLMAFARYHEEVHNCRMIIHYCRGLINLSYATNENTLSVWQRVKLNWSNPYRKVPSEYIDFPD